MAGEWIKMRTDLHTDPAVMRLAVVLNVDTFQIVGWLHAVWVWADTHADRHGHVTLVSRSCLDSITRRAGFGDALEAVGWLRSEPEDAGGITFPRFDRHMGEGAKARALAAKRKKNQREREAEARHAAVPKASRADRDSTVTREEKRREEKKEEETPSESCPEPGEPASVPVPTSPVVMSFPCTGKGPKEWPLTEAKVAEYCESFPGMDVLAAMRAARQWCVDNAGRRKTFRGMPAFCSRWLTDDQNRGKNLRTTGTSATLPFRPPGGKRTFEDVIAEAEAEAKNRERKEEAA